MKTTLKFLLNACMLFALVFTSCKKDDLADAVIPEVTIEPSAVAGQNGSDGTDGSNGTNGSNGTDGSDGTNGTDGADGEDGQDGVDGQDGADGEQGPAGADGQDGQDGDDGDDGADGDDGQDGNANVISSSWEKTNFGSTFNSFSQVGYTIEDPRINQDVLDNYAILGYLSTSQNINQVWQLPLVSFSLDKFVVNNYVKVGEYRVVVTTDDRSKTPRDYYVRYVLIEHSSLSGKGHSIESLQKMNYRDAMQALGLNE